MKNYVISRNEENKIVVIHGYDKAKHSTETIKEKILQWEGDTILELIEDEKTIEILNYYFRIEDNEGLENRCEKLEEAIEDIKSILIRL